MTIYHKGASQKDQCAHLLMDSPPDPDWHGSTVIGNWIAYYHEERLYSVWDSKRGILSLVYAGNPTVAIEKVKGAELPDG